MAAVEVLAFAAGETYVWPPSRLPMTTGNGLREDRIAGRGNQYDVASLNYRLALIAKAWVNLRSASYRVRRESRLPRSLIVQDFCSPKWSRARRQPQPAADEPESSARDLLDPTATGSAAQRRNPDFRGCDGPIPHPNQPGENRPRRGAERGRDLIVDPNMDLLDLDLYSSGDGFYQAAGKKKKKQTTTFNWLDDEGDKKDVDGAEGGGDGNKDQNGGDSGAGGNSGNTGGDGGNDGDKKDEDKNDGDPNDGDPNNDDIWTFTPVGGKKKNKNKVTDVKTTDALGLPDIPSTDFHEIKLDDVGGGGDSLDLGLGTKAEKLTSGITAWTSSWATGSWGWGNLKSPGPETSKPVEEEKSRPPDPVDDNPWSINRGKPKKKTTTFDFGSFGQDEENKDEPLDFLGSSKSNEKKDLGGYSWGVPAAKTADDAFWGNLGENKAADDKPKEEEKPAATQEASDDIWGWSSTKKDKKKKNKIAVIDDAPASEESVPQPVPDPPQSQEHSEEVSKREAEAALIAEEEAELRKLQTKKDIGSKLTKKQQDRYKFLTENAKTREEAAAAAAADFKADEQPHTETGHAVDPLLDGGSFVANSVGGDADAADAEKDEKARLIQEEEDEMFILKSKKKLKKSEKERLRVLEEHADQRAREAEEATATQELDQTITEVIDSADATVEDLAPEADGTAQAEADGTAQAEADERAKMIQAEEEELAQLHAKKKPKKGDRDRIRILEERVEERAREAEAATAAAEQFIQESSGDTTDFKTDETAPISVDDHLVDDNAAQAEQDEAARIIEDEEAELELLLMKSKLKKAEKARLKELQDNKERREQEAAAKAEADAFPNSNVDAGDVPPTEDVAADEGLVESVAPNNDETELAAKIIDEEEMELDILLAKSKLKKSEKTRLKELQDRKELREQEAAAKAEAAAKDGAAADVPFEETPVGNAPSPEAGPVDEAALQKEAEDAIVAAEDSELSELLAKSKLKKSERSRLKELQDRKDKRDEEVRVAAAKAEEEEQMAREKAEQEARELDEQKKREEEEKRAAEIAAEQAEISTLKAKKKLKRSEKDRLAELEFRRDERASAEAAQLAEELLKEDAANDADTKNDPEPLSWADDDPAQDNGANDDWLGWGLSSSKKSKKTKGEAVPDPPATDLEPQSKPEEDDTWSAWGTSKKDKKKKGKSSNLIDFGGADDTPVVLDPVNPVPEATGFDFGWGKPSKIVEPVVDDIWSFGGSSKKKKSKDAPVEVLEDTNAIKAIDEGESKGAGDDFWPTFGAGKSLKDKKSSSKDDLVAISPPQAPTPPYTDLTETGDGDGTIAWDDPSGSTELTKTKSLVSDKDSKKSSTSKEPKLSKKELEKLEKEKKKAEKEQKAREEQEAKEAAERARIEEEERLAAEAKAEEERLAQEEADRIRRVEEENQAALDAIAQEEADLTALQSKKDAGRKLTKKEKEKFDKLSASCQARADEKAAQEAAEQAAREEAERLQREAEEQARKAAIEKEEAELKDLQKKKDSGRKLLRKDKDRYELLTANKKARKQAEKEAEAAKEDPAPADEPKLDDDLEKDLAGLDANELDELDKFLSVPAKPVVKKAADVDPFSFWGASKKTTISSKKGQSSVAEPSASAEIAHAESSSSSKLLEATTSVSVDTTAHNDVAAAVAWPGWKDTFSSTPSEPAIEPCRESQNDEIETSVRAASPPAAEPMKRKSAFGGKIADRLKTFEAPKDESVPPPPPPVPANLIPPPPPPAAVAPIEAVKTKKKSKKTTEIPGSFPTEEDEHPDDIIEVIDMSPAKSKKSSSKKSSKAKSEDTPIPIPPPPPAVPDAPTSPPEGKKERKKERPKINRDGGSSWGMWTASTPREKEKKSSSKSKAAEEPRKESKSRSPEKEENLSSKGSSSDKAERADKKEKAKEKHALPKVTSVFASTPPISRSISTREKRHKEGKSSRRTSIDVNNGMISPPPEEMPEINSKAAKILGIGEGMGIDRSISSRKKSSRPIEDDDIVMVGANDAGPSPEKSSRRRPSKSYARDDDIVMVDAADATPTPGLRRSNTTGSARKGLGSLFGGILSTPRTEARRRNTYHTDGEDAGAATEADVEAVKAARRARRVEREVTERSKSETRREKRRRQEEAAEAQRQAEKEARRVERRAARAREEEERRTTEEKDAAREERRRQKRAEREKEREALEIGGEDADAEARRAARRERRKARTGESDLENDEDRRRRRAERRAARDAEGKSLPRRRTEPVEDDFVYPRPERISRRHTDDMERGSRESAAEAPTWPHSGLSSWVKDHSDAGPPPEDGGMTTEAVDDENGGDEDAARRERRRRRRYGDTDVEGSGDRERRRKRREERSDGSDERRRERKGSLFVDGPGARGSGGIGGFWKKLTRN